MQGPVAFHNRGQKIHGMIHMPEVGEKSSPGIVMCHGLGGTKVEAQRLFLRLSRRLEGEGIASMRFDLRGCGESDGYLEEMAFSDHLSDLQAALEFFASHEAVDSKRIGLLGYSLGGGIASIVAPKSSSVKALAIWSSPADLMGSLLYVIPEDMITTIDKAENCEYRGKMISGDFIRELREFSPAVDIGAFNGPVLVIHGTQDNIVHPVNADTFSKKLQERDRDAEVFLIDGADHHFSSVKWQEELMGKTVSWFKEKL